MPLEPFALQKFSLQISHNAMFLRRQGIGILRIERRKIRRSQFIGSGIQRNGPCFQIDFMEQQAVIHIIFRMTEYNLPFQLG